MGTENGWGTDWSADGKFVLYQRPGERTGPDLWIAPVGPPAAGEQKPFPYLDSPFIERNGVFSPDGRWVAYESDESGRLEIYVQAFPATREKVRISSRGGTDPAWNRSGTELFYLAADRMLMSVPVTLGPTTIVPGAPTGLFQVPGSETRRSYAVSRDGRRFLIAKPVDDVIAEPVTIVLWHERLTR